MTDPCFRMKGTTLTSVVVEVHRFAPDEFKQQLAEKVQSAPQFFTRSSLILHLAVSLSATEFELLVALCRQFELQPMAVKGETQGLKGIINDLGLADVSQSKFTDSVLKSPQQPAQNEQSPAPQDVVKTVTVETMKPAKVINRPVRSGQQIYAEGCDLVITAAVSEGAEVLADGNIHVYGTLRGRALAGAKGNIHARVFCHSLDAELISIAGQFVMHDTIKSKCWKQPAQIYLEDDTLQIESLA